MRFAASLLLAVAACAPAPAAVNFLAPPSQTACGAPFNVGYEVVRVGDLHVGMWYPASTAEGHVVYADRVPGRAAPEAGVERCTRFPLVVFSHGLGGCGIQSVFFTEELARRGYIVAAPDHKDALCTVTGRGNFRFVTSDESLLRPDLWTAQTQVDRRDDLRRVIDGITGYPKFRGAIAPGKIGAAGHSVGGYALLGMGGGWDSWKDDRIGALLLFSPFAAPFLSNNRLGAVSVPVMYQGAQGDLGITPFLRGANGAYAASKPPKYYLELRLGNHFIWTNLQCLDVTAAECRRRTVEARLITEYGTAFFDRYLKGDPGPLSRLNGSGAAVFTQSP